MGGVVSTGRNNDDLIDNLLDAEYIKTSIIERVFRAVDRAEYYLPEARGNAYKDLAWKSGNLHLSAPCIYSEVLEGLCLEPGLSFLNLGSGTGYLSTMVGLVLGSYGVNHGIEYHADVVHYANKRLEDFRKFSGALDEFDFVEPKFVQGNCLCLTSDCNARYDRVYCGAACPEKYESYMKNLLKVGGILVMPLNDTLVQIKRITETTWETRSLLPVSFASLILPPEGSQEWIQPIDVEPLTLQGLCRTAIRNMLRKNYEQEHPPVKRPAPANRAVKKKRSLRKYVVPLFDSEESSDDDRRGRNRGDRRDAGSPPREENNGLLNYVLDSFRERRPNVRSPTISVRRNDPVVLPPDEDNESFLDRVRRTRCKRLTGVRQDNNVHFIPSTIKFKCRKAGCEPDALDEDNRMDEDTAESTEESDRSKSTFDTRAVIENTPGSSRWAVPRQTQFTVHNKSASSTEPPRGIDHDEINRFASVLNQHRRGRTCGDCGVPPLAAEEDEDVPSGRDQDRSCTQIRDDSPGAGDLREDVKKREKFDSGLGDEIVENPGETSDEIISSSDDEQKGYKRGQAYENESRSAQKWRRIESDIHQMIAESSSECEDDARDNNAMRMYQSPYTEYMNAKIRAMPLPSVLKKYLVFNREI